MLKSERIRGENIKNTTITERKILNGYRYYTERTIDSERMWIRTD